MYPLNLIFICHLYRLPGMILIQYFESLRLQFIVIRALKDSYFYTVYRRWFFESFLDKFHIEKQLHQSVLFQNDTNKICLVAYDIWLSRV